MADQNSTPPGMVTPKPKGWRAQPAAGSGKSTTQQIADVGRSGYGYGKDAVTAIGHQLYPDRPPNVATSPAGQKLTDFADDLNRQRQGFTPTTAPGVGTDTQQRSLALQESAARGQQPSQAESLYRAGADEAARRQLGAAAALQGSNPGEALRAGLAGGAQTELASTAGAAALRANEMATARSGFQAGSDAARGQDLSEQGLNNTYQLTLNQQTGQALKTPAELAQEDADRQQKHDAAGATTTGTLLGGGGQALMALSDEREKKDIRPAAREAQDFLDQLEPKKYQWKDPGDTRTSGPGEHLGVIAQDLLKSSTTTGPDGKKYISADVIGQVLAGMGALNKRVDAVAKGNG